jgi:hypothetical protein
VATPVTIPVDAPIVATEVFELPHANVPLEVASLKVLVGEALRHKLFVPVIAEIVGRLFTVTTKVAVPEHDPEVNE